MLNETTNNERQGNHNTPTFPLLVCFISFAAHILAVQHVYVSPLIITQINHTTMY